MASLSITAVDAFVPRIIAALRGTFPNQTQGLTDAQVIKTCIKNWLVDIVSQYEANQQIVANQAAWKTQYTQSNTDGGANIS